MMIATFSTRPKKAKAKRKEVNKPLTFADVRIAARGGDEAFAYYVASGKLPASK